jgi:8-oxo-dGTP diphosphatase
MVPFEMDWSRFEPKERATILFVVRDGEVLLIRKKRGLGAGKINGPGGRIDGAETPLEGALREVQEELCVVPHGVTLHGLLRFQFVDGYSLLVHVFRARGCDGVAQETDEAIPLWCAVDALPYDAMWHDDRYWLPHLLAGRSFDGAFVFDGDRMLRGELSVDGVSQSLDAGAGPNGT